MVCVKVAVILTQRMTILLLSLWRDRALSRSMELSRTSLEAWCVSCLRISFRVGCENWQRTRCRYNEAGSSGEGRKSDHYFLFFSLITFGDNIHKTF